MKTLLVSHDAGGAEILSAWYRNSVDKYDLYCCLAGPALKIFQRDHRDIKLVNKDFISSLSGNDWILTGTSLESDLERSVIALARESKIHCVSYLEHWDLYKERFGDNKNWLASLPDELWLTDQYAFDFALKEGFPEEKLVIAGNPYLDLIKAKNPPEDIDGIHILYMCESFGRKLKESFGEKADEYDDELIVMKHFIKGLTPFADKVDSLNIRLHPSEPHDKYNDILTDYSGAFTVTVPSDIPLFDNISQSSHVVGVESMGLVVALELGKRVFSYKTGKDWEISLPHKEIIHINEVQDIFLT